MRNFFRTGGLIQFASALTLVAQNLLAPRIMGAESYGEAIGLMAFPLLIQGLIEPMSNGAMINARSRSDHLNIVRRTWGHLSVCAIVSLILTLILGTQWRATLFQLALIGGVAVTVLANTALRGLAFSGQRYHVLTAHYLGAFVASLVSLPLLYFGGVAGYLGMMFLVQITVFAVLLSDLDVRREAFQIVFYAVSTIDVDYSCARTYVTNLSSRVGQVSLGPGMLLLASAQFPTVMLAEFRIFQTLIGALAYLVPFNATLIQARMAGETTLGGRDGRANAASQAFLTLMLGLTLVILATAIMWVLYPDLVAILLQSPGNDSRFRNLIWFAPLYVLVPLLGGVLLGAGVGAGVLLINLICIPTSFLLGVLFGAGFGLASGSVLFAGFYAIAVFRSSGSHR